MNNFEIKKKIVLSGGSRIFNNWAAHSTITLDEFVSALEWVCADPMDDNGKMTREIALAPDRIVKLRRINDRLLRVPQRQRRQRHSWCSLGRRNVP